MAYFCLTSESQGPIPMTLSLVPTSTMGSISPSYWSARVPVTFNIFWAIFVPLTMLAPFLHLQRRLLVQSPQKNASRIWSPKLIIWVAQQYDEFSYIHNLRVWHHIKKYDASYNIKFWMFYSPFVLPFFKASISCFPSFVSVGESRTKFRKRWLS